MTIYTGPRVLIIPADMQERANAVGHVLDPDTGGYRSFTAGLSASGQHPATHYICSTLYTDQTVELLDSPDATAMHEALQQLAAARGRGYTLSLSDLQELRDKMVVSASPLAATLGSVGLRFVQESVT